MAVIKGGIRGNGRQLASYLLSDQNEEARIIEVADERKFGEREFYDLIQDFSLNERLTKSRQGIYHAIINPPEELAARMTDAEWILATNVLAGELGFSDQRRAVVFHKNKQGRCHVHIAFERYDHEKGKMIPIPHNYRKHDKARAKIEQIFDEKPTAQRNPNRKLMKENLTALWQQTINGREFLKAAQKQGYVVTDGYRKGSYAVVDPDGQSHKLVSHLKGVLAGEVNERLKGIKLISEKDALAFASTRKTVTQDPVTVKQDPIAEKTQKSERQEFLDRLAEQRKNKNTYKPGMH